MKKKLTKRWSQKIGLPPGSMIHIGEKKVSHTKFTVIEFNSDLYAATTIENPEELNTYRDSANLIWIDVTGLHETEKLEKVGTIYGLHSLVLEDIFNTTQRPKLEVYEEYIFVVMKMMHYDESNGEIDAEQISIILGNNYVITFQEREGDIFDPVRGRLKNSQGTFRKRGIDYLFYTLMDIIVDYYFLILEKIGDQIEELEDKVMDNPQLETVKKIQFLKRELIKMRRSIWPLRELISTITREEMSFITKSTAPYLRDLHDHTIQVIDSNETYREMVGVVLDIYLSSMSNKMNEIMKVLTIIATIFIPLTFLAGIYGMNFEFMPELHWKWGYFVFWILILVIFMVMFIFFRRKKWI